MMSPEHKDWKEFLDGLHEACKFRKNNEGRFVWNCDHQLKNTVKLLKKFKITDVEDTLKYFAERGGVCDCTICLNFGVN